jgi:hypothetical protein
MKNAAIIGKKQKFVTENRKLLLPDEHLHHTCI